MSPTRTSIGDVWRATMTSPVPIVGSMLPDITVRLFAWKAFGSPTASTRPPTVPSTTQASEQDHPAEGASHWFCASQVKATSPVSPCAAKAFCIWTVNR